MRKNNQWKSGMTEMLELYEKYFKIAVTRMFQQAIMNALEINLKNSLGKEREDIKENQTENRELIKCNNQKKKNKLNCRMEETGKNQ